MTILWLRWYHGTTADQKWRVVATEATRILQLSHRESQGVTNGVTVTCDKVTVAHVISVWSSILECASENADRGCLCGWSSETIAATIDATVAQVDAIYQAMQGRVLEGNRLKSWEKRNPKREDNPSAERTRAYRQRHTEKLTVTQCDSISAQVTLDTDTDTDKDKEGKKKGTPATPLPPRQKKSRQPDPAFEEFVEAFERFHAPAKYNRARPQDYVHLAGLRRTQGIGTDQTPPEWTTAIGNYFASGRSAPSVADLANNYPTFVKSPLDRYGKPAAMEQNNAESKSAAKVRGIIEAGRLVNQRLLGANADWPGSNHES